MNYSIVNIFLLVVFNYLIINEKLLKNENNRIEY